MTDMCPHCGFDLQVDTPIATPWFVYRPDSSLCDMGGDRVVVLTPSESSILGTVLKARGRTASLTVLIERSGCESARDDETGIVRVFIRRLRAKLGPFGGEHIRVVYGKGYRWSGGFL